MTDIAIKQLHTGRFDTSIVSGDIESDDGLRTAVILSLFTDRIAANDDAVPDGSGNRRGYWADAFTDDGDRFGSRLWLLDREKETTTALQLAEEYAKEALQWCIDDGIGDTVEAMASWLKNGWLSVQVTIYRNESSLYEETFNFSLEQV